MNFLACVTLELEYPSEKNEQTRQIDDVVLYYITTANNHMDNNWARYDIPSLNQDLAQGSQREC